MNRKQLKQKKKYRRTNIHMGQDFDTGNMNAEYLQMQHNMAENQRLFHGVPPLLPMPPMVPVTNYYNQWEIFSSVQGVLVVPQRVNPGSSSLDSSPNSSFSPNLSNFVKGMNLAVLLSNKCQTLEQRKKLIK